MDVEEVLVIQHIVNDLIQAEEDADAPNRQIHNPVDPFVVMSDVQLVGLFRVTKALAQEIIDLLTPYLYQGQTEISLEIKTKVLVTLLFHGHGSYQKITGKNLFCGISQASVSRCINEVTAALNQQDAINQWINFPRNINELQQLRARFFAKYNFPGVVGCIDCTHVAIVALHQD